MRQHQPRVIVYDVAIPYDVNWRLFEHFRGSPACRDVGFVVTTTNEHQLRKLSGTCEELHEIIGKPYDLDEIVRAVQQAAGSQTEAAEPGRRPPETDPIDR